MVRDSTTRPAPSRLLRVPKQAPVIEEAEPHVGGAWRFADEFEAREAASNFRLYLAILQEWDEKEKERERRRDKLD